jgi:tRNA(Ile)-lysidine synthase
VDPVQTALQEAGDSDLMPSGSSILLAVSGGADSMALLYGARELADRASWRLSVGHVHHGWRGRQADRDLAFVAEHARRLGLPFFSRRRDARALARRQRLSPEAGAREARYAALAEMAREAQAARIATAHQRDDRTESLLMALERGAGLAAAAGPKPFREDGVVRPLLAVSRPEILDFLARREITYRRDSTNGDLSLQRNRVRRALGRLARARPEALSMLQNHADRLAAERERVEIDFQARVRPHLANAPGSVVADAGLLAGCSTALQRHALEEAARPFARPGRPPLTGREREQILTRLQEGGDFRFEAGRRIRFERRGKLLTVFQVQSSKFKVST